MALAQALAEIRDKKLYRAGFSTFEEYCRQKWGFSKQRAYQLLEGAETVKSLPAKSQPLVDSERQARALALVPPEQRAEVLEAANASGKVTAASITTAAQKETAIIELDKTGYPIPESILEDWWRAEAQRELLTQISEVRSRLKAALESEDVIFAEVSNTTIADLDNAYTTLKCVIPYAVCTSCQGLQRKKCTLCKQRGFLSKFGYEHWIPKETRELRERVRPK